MRELRGELCALIAGYKSARLPCAYEVGDEAKARDIFTWLNTACLGIYHFGPKIIDSVLAPVTARTIDGETLLTTSGSRSQ